VELALILTLENQGTDEILGATIVARPAGEIISEIAMAMSRKIGLALWPQSFTPIPSRTRPSARPATSITAPH
jgi:pyruvate/2-oxoglutarate dehydrogenase complex dihydrolipoamide dehydrogenase (E3) component